MASAFKNNPKWVKRMEEFFMQTDLDKNNHLSIEDFEIWIENIRKEVNPDPLLVDKLYEVVREFWGACGLIPGVQLTKDQFIDNMAEFAVTENARRDRGEEPMLYKLDDIFYDVADTNRDGFISLDEYEVIQRALHFEPGVAKTAFDIIDKNHDGKLSREELNEQDFNFWFTLDDETTSGMFGEKYQ